MHHQGLYNFPTIYYDGLRMLTLRILSLKHILGVNPVIQEPSESEVLKRLMGNWDKLKCWLIYYDAVCGIMHIGVPISQCLVTGHGHTGC